MAIANWRSMAFKKFDISIEKQGLKYVIYEEIRLDSLQWCKKAGTPSRICFAATKSTVENTKKASTSYSC
jgi:hypothetical protein